MDTGFDGLVMRQMRLSGPIPFDTNNVARWAGRSRNGASVLRAYVDLYSDDTAYGRAKVQLGVGDQQNLLAYLRQIDASEPGLAFLPDLFYDGFESGDTTARSARVP